MMSLNPNKEKFESDVVGVDIVLSSKMEQYYCAGTGRDSVHVDTRITWVRLDC